jgi:uncharacterized protein
MYSRIITRSILEAMADTPAVFLQGARQVGKTTLARQLADAQLSATFLTLDDASVLAAARTDPVGFLSGLKPPVVLDEVQRVPELALALKAAIDRDRAPGQYLLTGSARLLTLPSLSDALVGRMEVVTLWPLSQQETEETTGNWVDLLFSGAEPLASSRPCDLTELRHRLAAGGFPEALARPRPARRARWYESYVTTLLQREVRDLAQVEDLATFPRLLALAAARTAQLTNLSDLARAAGLPNTTLRRYMALLEGVFLLHYLPAWSTNRTKRVTRSPKLHLTDSGLASHLVGLDEGVTAGAGVNLGALVETFAVNEVLRQRDVSSSRPAAFHFRTHTGIEADLLLEDRRGRLVGIEIKAAGSVGARDLKGLRYLEREYPAAFVRGIVLYGGDEVVPFSERIVAVPMSALWT